MRLSYLQLLPGTSAAKSPVVIPSGRVSGLEISLGQRLSVMFDTVNSGHSYSVSSHCLHSLDLV